MGLTPENEREVERLLAQANLERMRGQWSNAEETLRKAASIAPQDVVIRELLGDVLAECGKLDMALAEYRTAMQESPGKVSLETKYAKAVLAISERERQRALAEDMLANPHKYTARQKKPGTAFLFGLIPGLGQIYNGEYVKGGIITGIVLLFFIAWATLQSPYSSNIRNIQEFISETNQIVLVIGFMAFVAYIYGLVDAPIAADKHSKAAKETGTAK